MFPSRSKDEHWRLLALDMRSFAVAVIVLSHRSEENSMKRGIAVVALVTLTSAPTFSQKGTRSSATIVSAELMRGKLNPSESKPGDQVTLRLKEEVKSY